MKRLWHHLKQRPSISLEEVGKPRKTSDWSVPWPRILE
jgi:hypothetical protein